MNAIDALGAADGIGTCELKMDVVVQQIFDPMFKFIGKLETVGSEKLDAVVLIGIVRSGDHHSDIRPQRARQHGDGRGRDRAEQKHIKPRSSKSRDQRILDHVA
jgi:hypothetical protein